MRILIAFVLLTWSYGLCAQRQQEVGQEQKTDPLPQERDLSVNAQITTQKYCHMDDDSFAVRMEIKLRFTNVSDHPVILAKRIEDPPIVRAARSIEDAKKGNFEYDPNVDFFPGKLPPSPRFGEKPDKEHFITLAPEQSYEARVVSGVFGAIAASKARKGSGLLAQGKHVLQLGVGTWPYDWPYFESSTDVRQLAERWSSYGHLANGILYSDLVPFSIPDKFDNPLCEAPNQR